MVYAARVAAKGKKRPRSERRELERTLRKQVGQRQKLVAAGPGGGADRPLPVRSASVIEAQARATPCIQCGGELELQSHAAEPGPSDVRVVRLTCRLCHAPRAIWFRIEPSRAN